MERRLKATGVTVPEIDGFDRRDIRDLPDVTVYVLLIHMSLIAGEVKRACERA